MAFTTISNLFGASPFKPLQQHMERVQECTAQLAPFFDAVLKQDWQEVKTQQQEITRLENQADDLKRQLRLKLPSSLFMAVSRRDLLELLTMQDKIANKAKDIAGLITGRHMAFPDKMGPLIKSFVMRSIDAFEGH